MLLQAEETMVDHTFTGYLISFCGLRDLSETNHRRRVTVLPCYHATAGFQVCGCRDEVHGPRTHHDNGTVKVSNPLATSSDLPLGDGPESSVYTVAKVVKADKPLGELQGQYRPDTYHTPPRLVGPLLAPPPTSPIMPHPADAGYRDSVWQATAVLQLIRHLESIWYSCASRDQCAGAADTSSRWVSSTHQA